MGTILLKNGMVYDGLGNPAVQQDILINGDKIEKIGCIEETEVKQVIDVQGKIV